MSPKFYISMQQVYDTIFSYVAYLQRTLYDSSFYYPFFRPKDWTIRGSLREPM